MHNIIFIAHFLKGANFVRLGNIKANMIKNWNALDRMD